MFKWLKRFIKCKHTHNILIETSYVRVNHNDVVIIEHRLCKDCNKSYEVII